MESKRRADRHNTTAVGQSILRGLNEAVSWVAGQEVTTRETTLHVPRVDVRGVREKMGLSQQEFANKFGFKIATVRNWEQGRRAPELPARILLAVVEKHPDLVEQVLASDKVFRQL